MKKTKTILHVALLTALSTSAYAQYEQQGYPSRNITTNETTALDRGDFSSDLSQEEAQRNLKGECDSTCDILVPVLPPNPVGSILTNLARATLETESRNLTCQAAGYPANYIGQVSQSRTYTSQNGVPIASSYSAWNTVSNTCTAPAPCSSVNLSWTASGNTCSGTVAAASSGSNSSVSNTAANRTGNATYSCNNGTWTYVSGSCAMHLLHVLHNLFHGQLLGILAQVHWHPLLLAHPELLQIQQAVEQGQQPTLATTVLGQELQQVAL